MLDKESKKVRAEIRRKQYLAGPKQRAWRIPDKKKKESREACRKGKKYDLSLSNN